MCVCTLVMMSEKRDKRERRREGVGEEGREGVGEGEGEREDVQCTFCIHVSLVFILHCRPSAQKENKTTQY